MRANCEWLKVEAIDEVTAVVHIAHNPYSSFSRSIRPWILRHFANLIPAMGIEFVKRLSAEGCELDLMPGDGGVAMTNDRCVTLWRFKIAA